MAYGTVKVDQITFTNGGIDQTVTVSGIVQSISGDITATGTIQGATIIGTSTVSGATVTGNAGVFTTVTGGSAGFTTVTGTTVTGTTANFATLSGTTITGSVGNFGSGSAAAPSVSVGTTDNGIYSPGANQLAISTNGTGRLFVDADGEVGIGTASPAAGLHISNSAPTLRLQDTDGTQQYSSIAQLGANLYVDVRDGAAGGATIVRTYPSIERLRITSDGKVGVGTSSPKAGLHVANDITANSNSFYASNLYYDGGWKFIANGSGGAFKPADSAGYMSFLMANAVNSSGADAAATVDTKMVITPGGNVGVGTTSPQNELSVVGTGNATTGFTVGSEDGNTSGGIYNAGSTSNSISIIADPDNVGANSRISFFVDSTTSEAARIDSSGRLLVGTSSTPVAIESITPQIVSSTEDSLNGDVAIYTYRNAGGSGRQTVAPRLFFARSRSGTNGSIGGIVNDNEDIGNIRFAADDGTQFLTAAEILVEVDGTPGANDMPGRLVFSVTANGSASPTQAMRINNAGELLVGYTSDNGAYKLQVNSQIFATSATIATSDGRYKENVATLDGCVDLVKALRPVSFDWKHQEPITRIDEEGETVVVREAHNFPDGTQVGFIAQEVETVLADKPWLGSVIKQNVRPAVTDNDGNELAPEEEFLGIAEGNLVAVLTSALQEAIGEIESLKARVAALEAS